jgi:hypothetical protein
MFQVGDKVRIRKGSDAETNGIVSRYLSDKREVGVVEEVHSDPRRYFVSFASVTHFNLTLFDDEVEAAEGGE